MKTEGSSSTQGDLEKLKKYNKMGIKHAYFIMIDEDETHMNRIIKHLQINNWKMLDVNGKKSYCVILRHDTSLDLQQKNVCSHRN